MSPESKFVPGTFLQVCPEPASKKKNGERNVFEHYVWANPYGPEFVHNHHLANGSIAYILPGRGGGQFEVMLIHVQKNPHVFSEINVGAVMWLYDKDSNRLEVLPTL